MEAQHTISSLIIDNVIKCICFAVWAPVAALV
jgi:hypothetical protein